MPRIDGQIWIDKNTPHRLKYYVAGEEYSVEVSANYELSSDPDNVGIHVGTVVKFTGAGVLSPAVFPDDIENILGVVASITRSVDANDSTIVHYTAAISRSGYLLLETPSNVFLADDLNIIKNGWGNATAGIGAPVYWFIGRTTVTSGVYAYEAPSTHSGFLTLSTPSGYKWNVTDPPDNTMNVGYDNLPQVGTVAGYTLSGNTVTSIQIHLNFARFDTSLEWSWPYLHKVHTPFVQGDCGKITSGNNLTIRHGLFCDSTKKLRNFCNIIALDDSSNEYVVSTGAINTYTGTDRKTAIQLSTPDDLYYRVTGTINYNFDKGHN